MKSISPEQARQYLKRWSIVADAERSELRESPMGLKFRQLAALMASAHLFHDPAERAVSEDQVRARWAKIRRA